MLVTVEASAVSVFRCVPLFFQRSPKPTVMALLPPGRRAAAVVEPFSHYISTTHFRDTLNVHLVRQPLDRTQRPILHALLSIILPVPTLVMNGRC